MKEINTEEDYQKALKMIDEVFDTKEGTPEADKAEELAKAIELFEDKHYPMKKPTEGQYAQLIDIPKCAQCKSGVRLKGTCNQCGSIW